MSTWRIGIDLGATKIALGLISPCDQVVARERIPTLADEGPLRVVTRIVNAVGQLTQAIPSGEALAAAGICCPGPVDHIAGRLIDPPNLPALHHTPLRQMLAERLGLPVALDHDAKAAALGEFHYGAGRGEKSMVYVVIGSGVGAAMIDQGRLLRGEHNSAGEMGHITLDRYGELCSCGSHGCVETYLSGPWIARRYQQACGVHDPAMTCEQIARLAAQGDTTAIEIFTQAGQALGVAVATVAMTLNIDLFVIGSSVAKVGDLLLQPARGTIANYCYQSVSCCVRILPSALGDDAPILGCGWLAQQNL